MSELFSPAIISLLLSTLIVFIGLIFINKNKTENVSISSRISIQQDEATIDNMLRRLNKDKLANKEEEMGYFEKKKMQLEQSNCGISYSVYTVLMILSVLIIFVIVYKIIGISIVALPFSFLGIKIPDIIVSKKQSKNIEHFNTQLIKALRRMASIMRSGGSIKQALVDITNARSIPLIIRKEFETVLADIEYGYTIEEALYKLYKRTGSKDVKLLAISISIQRNVGGNIARTLDTISQSISNRNLMEQEVKATMGQLKATSTILSIMPFFIGIILYFLNPGHFDPFFNSLTGRFMFLICIIFILIGMFVVKKMSRIDI